MPFPTILLDGLSYDLNDLDMFHDWLMIAHHKIWQPLNDATQYLPNQTAIDKALATVRSKMFTPANTKPEEVPCN